MNRISEKIYLTLTPPTEEENGSIQQNLLTALSNRGYTNIHCCLAGNASNDCRCGSW